MLLENVWLILGAEELAIARVFRLLQQNPPAATLLLELIVVRLNDQAAQKAALASSVHINILIR